MRGSAPAAGATRKVKRVLETRIDTPEIVTSLSSLSEIYKENNETSRQQLRAMIDARNVQINDSLLEDARHVLDELDLVEEEISLIVRACDKICATLEGSKSATVDLLRETERLTLELQANTRKQELIGSFLGTYQLLPEEVSALQGDIICEEFFAALSHVQEIHSNCKSLLRTHHQRAGLELMDVMAGYQESAYDKLCRWVQEEFRSLSDDDAPEPHELLGLACIALQERPILFKYCTEEISNMCHNALFRRFITALTRGGPGGQPKPIEMHAHDPQRYVGDMLAWLYQASSAERKVVSLLFKGKNGQIRTDLPVTYGSIFDKIVDGVSRPFRVRFEQVLSSNVNMLEICKLSSMLLSYVEMLKQGSEDRSLLSDMLLECHSMAELVFKEQVDIFMEKVLKNAPRPPSDLGPPSEVRDVLQRLSDAADACSLSYSHTGDIDGLNSIVDGFLTPLEEMCEKSAMKLENNSSTSLEHRGAAYYVYMINCRSAIMSMLKGHPLLNKSATDMADSIEKLSGAFVKKEVDEVLEGCGVQELIKGVQSNEAQHTGDTSTSQPMVPELLVQALNRLFDWFASKQQPLPAFQSIQFPSLRKQLVQRVASELQSSYVLLHTALCKCSDNPSVHTPAQFQTLLGGSL